MENYLITWFYAEEKENESYYPSSGGDTSTSEFQTIYWQCIYNFYKSAIITNSDINYVFFTNLNKIPNDINGINMQEFFEENQIEIQVVLLTKKTPKDWHSAWRNQFYEYDILKYLGKLEGNILILDSDCLIRKSLKELYDLIEHQGIVAYSCGYAENHSINGINLAQMRKLYTTWYKYRSAVNLDYYGGEFIALRCDQISSMLEIFECMWQWNYELYIKKAPYKLNEEAHFLSLIYTVLGGVDIRGDRYIKRMWTSVKCDNINKNDEGLPIWHLPAEKKYGFTKLFEYMKRHPELTRKEYLDISDRIMGVSKSSSVRKFKKVIVKVSELCKK